MTVEESSTTRIAVVKQWKEQWVEMTDRGDMPPTIILTKGDEHLLTATAPQVDNRYAYAALNMMCPILQPDAIVLVADAHVAARFVGPGSNLEEAKAEHLRQYPNGMQAACDDHGACERGEMSDAMLIFGICRDGQKWMEAISYSYHGKGTTFRWTDDDPKYQINRRNGEVAGGEVPARMEYALSRPHVREHPLYRVGLTLFGIEDTDVTQANLLATALSKLKVEGFLMECSIDGIDLASL